MENIRKIYETQFGDSSDDDKKLLELVPILIDWLRFHPSKPFDVVKASEEFKKHRAVFLAELNKTQNAIRADIQTDADALFEACRKLGESRFTVRALDGKNDRFVQWHTMIKDPETKQSVGIVRELFPVGWVRPQLDPRNKDQTQEYLTEIHRLFNGMTHHCTHNRNLTYPAMELQKAPFPKRLNHYYSFNLKLQWTEA